jgi:putative holliday junction resolvase
MQERPNNYQDKFLIGVDFGEATTGLALGKNGVVTPVRAVDSRDKMTAVQEIMRLVKENKAVLIVVGLPLSITRKETPESIEVRRFSKLLQTSLGTPVAFVDEFGSSREALRDAIEGELPQKARKKVDSISASIILKRFFTDEGYE